MTGRIDYKRALGIGALIFIAFELILLPFIQLDVLDAVEYWQYLSVILAFLFSLLCLRGDRRCDLVRLGLAITLVADYFLVIDGKAYLAGVITFICAQIAYCLYLVLEDGRRAVRLANIYTRVGLCAALIIATYAVLGENTDALAIASVLYYANLVLNVVFAFLLGKGGRVFAIGLALFAMCDLCIGLETLGDLYIKSDAFDFMYKGSFNLPWVFYQPSQVMIGLSLYGKIKDK